VRRLKVVLIKPSKYAVDGYVERFWRGYMPNSALPYLKSMTPSVVDGADIEVHAIDEYVQTDLRYLELLQAGPANGWDLARSIQTVSKGKGHDASDRDHPQHRDIQRERRRRRFDRRTASAFPAVVARSSVSCLAR